MLEYKINSNNWENIHCIGVLDAGSIHTGMWIAHIRASFQSYYLGSS